MFIKTISGNKDNYEAIAAVVPPLRCLKQKEKRKEFKIDL